MKRAALLFFLLIIFSLSIISINAQDLQNNVKDAGKNVESTLEQTITIPDYLKIPVKILLGSNEQVTITQIAISLAVWIIFLFFFYQMLELTAFSNAVRWIVSIGMIGVLAVTGGLNFIINFILGILNTINFLENYPTLKIFSFIIIVIVFIFVAGIFLKTARKYKELKKAVKEGQEAGKGHNILKAISRVFKK